MDTQEQIEKLEVELLRLKSIQGRCNHKWGNTYKEYINKQVPIQENRPMGSDYFNPVTVGWEDQKISVWSRGCTICGLKQTTTKTEPVIEHHRPVF